MESINVIQVEGGCGGVQFVFRAVHGLWSAVAAKHLSRAGER